MLITKPKLSTITLTLRDEQELGNHKIELIRGQEVWEFDVKVTHVELSPNGWLITIKLEEEYAELILNNIFDKLIITKKTP